MLQCMLAQTGIPPSEGEGYGKGGHIFLLKQGLWEHAALLNDLLMSTTHSKDLTSEIVCCWVEEVPPSL